MIQGDIKCPAYGPRSVSLRPEPLRCGRCIAVTEQVTVNGNQNPLLTYRKERSADR